MKRPRLQTVVVTVAMLVGACGAAAQQGAPDGGADDGPVVVGARRGKYRWFELHQFDASLQFDGWLRSDKSKTGTDPTITDTEKYFRELVTLNGEAYFGHRNLLDVRGSVSLGYEDTYLDSQTSSLSSHDGAITSLYDLTGTLFQTSRLPVSLYARRDQTHLQREFGGTITSTSNEFGAIADTNIGRTQVHLQLFHREESQEDHLTRQNYGRRQDTLSWHSTTRITDRQNLDADYTLDRATDYQPSDVRDEYYRHDATVTHTFNVSNDPRDLLRSSLRVYNQGGKYFQSRVRLDEQLTLQHSERLETRYNFSLEDQDYGGSEQRIMRLSASLRHKLFESLITTASVGGTTLEIPDEFRSHDLFANLGWQYTKKVPLGHLDVDLAFGYDLQHNGDRGTIIPVLDESRTFADPFPITLARRNIVASSVIVKDVFGVRVFVEGSDYTLSAFPDRVEVRRVVGGAISDGDTVLISYELGPEPGSDIGSATVASGVRYSLDDGALHGTAFYVRYRRQDFSLSTSGDPARFVLDDAQVWTYGVEYRRGDYYARLERENHWSTVSPYNSTRLEGRYDRRVGRDSSLGLSATYEEIDYTDSADRIDLARFISDWTQRVSPTLVGRLRLQLRDEHNSASGNIVGFEQELILDWRKRQTSAYVSFRNAWLNGDVTDTLSQSVVFGLKRDF